MMKYYPMPVTKLTIEKILSQLINSFCVIQDKESFNGSGFFCKINYKNKNIHALIVFNCEGDIKYNNSLNILINNIPKTIEIGSVIYKNYNFGITVIEIKEKKSNEINFIELDNKLYEEESKTDYDDYDDKSIYIINYKNDNNNSVSYGKIKHIKNSEVKYYGNIEQKSVVSLIFNLSNNKLIGIHKSCSKFYNKGLLLKSIIKGFLHKFKFKYPNNEIDILIKVEKNSELNRKLYFLDNYKYKDNEGIKHYHDNLKELNELNTELYINDIKYKYEKYFIPDKLGQYKIKLKFKINLRNCSYMFANCKNIIGINFVFFNTEYVTDMKYMFHKCINLRNLNLLSFDTKLVDDMSNMFSFCYNLKNLELSSFNNQKVQKMDDIFFKCWNLNKLNLSYFISHYNKFINESFTKQYNNEINIQINVEESEFDNKIYFLNKNESLELNEANTILYIDERKTKFDFCCVPNNKTMSIILKFKHDLTSCKYMFYSCRNITNVYLFFEDTKNITDMSYMFYNCINLKNVYFSSKDTINITDMSYMFYNCINLNNIDLSSFDTENVTDMSYMFYNCRNLINLDLFSFDTRKVNNMSFMFYNCNKLVI